MQSRWMTHRGKKIFWAAFDHKTPDAMSAEMAEVVEELKKSPPKSVSLLSDTRGLIISPAILHLLQNQGKLAEPYLHKMAVLGVTGSVRISMFEMTLKIVNSGFPTRLFETETEALDWLAG